MWKLPIVDFVPLNNSSLLKHCLILFLPLQTKTISRIRLLEAVLVGQLSPKIGAITQARSTNTQSGVLRLYVSTEEPSYPLQRIVNYILFVYASVFLASKHFNKVEEGLMFLVQEIQAVKINCTSEEA